MRPGVSISVTSAPRSGQRPQRAAETCLAQIVLLSAEGAGTNESMREAGKSKTCVWRWQERFAAEGVDGLLRDKTRPSRIPKLDPSVAIARERVPSET
jgi:transposase